jgi:hypothetical protein
LLSNAFPAEAISHDSRLAASCRCRLAGDLRNCSEHVGVWSIFRPMNADFTRIAPTENMDLPPWLGPWGRLLRQIQFARASWVWRRQERPGVWSRFRWPWDSLGSVHHGPLGSGCPSGRARSRRQAKPAGKYLFAGFREYRERSPPPASKVLPAKPARRFPPGPRASGIQSVRRHLAARTIARMPALSVSGSDDHAWTTSARSASHGRFCASSAPHSAPL